jgi:hypothetical protein
MTGPRLFFESTRDFLQSTIRTVIPLHQKIPCESKALRDDVQGSTNACRQEPRTAILPPGEKCGLVLSDRADCVKRSIIAVANFSGECRWGDCVLISFGRSGESVDFTEINPASTSKIRLCRIRSKIILELVKCGILNYFL